MGVGRSELGMWKGYLFSIKKYIKGVPFLSKWYMKGQGVGLRGGASPLPGFKTSPNLSYRITYTILNEKSTRKSKVFYIILYFLMNIAFTLEILENKDSNLQIKATTTTCEHKCSIIKIFHSSVIIRIIMMPMRLPLDETLCNTVVIQSKLQWRCEPIHCAVDRCNKKKHNCYRGMRTSPFETKIPFSTTTFLKQK